MSPDEVESHAKAAKRQFGRLGRDHSHIDPARMRADAEVKFRESRIELSAPATKADIDELKQIILSLKPSTPNINVHCDRVDVDAVRRSTYQVAKMVRGACR